MGLHKGMTNNPHGRPKGSKNLKTLLWDDLGEFLLNEGSKKAIEYMKQLKGEEFIRHYKDLIKFFKPTLRSSEVKADVSHPVKLPKIEFKESKKTLDTYRDALEGKPTEPLEDEILEKFRKGMTEND